MESEIRRSSTRNQIKKSELPIDLPNLATSYVRQNNDLRKTLRRFEQEKQKQMRSIDGDIWELQKFMQELKCVTAVSAEDVMPFRERKPKERRADASRDKTLSRNSQNENVTSLNTESLSSTAPSGTVTGHTEVRNHQTRNDEPLANNVDHQRNSFWRLHERRRSSSVGDTSSATKERLKTIAGYNQPLLYRRKSLDAGNHMQPLLHRRNSLDTGNQPLLYRRKTLHAGNQPVLHRRKSSDAGKEAAMKMSFERNAQNTAEPHIRENIPGKVLDTNEQPTTTANITDSNSDTNFSFENGKFNALQREGSCRTRSCHQRPPSSVIEEAIVEADEVENFTVPGHSKTNLPSPNIAEIPNKKEDHDGRLLTRRSTCKLVTRPSSLGTNQLNNSNITDEMVVLTASTHPLCEKGIERNLFWQETLGYKETTSSRLRKQSSRDSAISLSLNEKNKRFRKIGLVQENLCKSAKSLAELISPKLHRKYTSSKSSGSGEEQSRFP